jgi:hypothetical protein
MAAPTTAVAGDTLTWTTSLSDYPASSGWVLTWRLVPASGIARSIVCTASGADHLATAAAATTAAWVAGRYALIGSVAKGAERYTVEQGAITITADLANAVTLDTRSSARKALEAADLALETYGAKAYLQQLAVGDRSKTFRSPAEFLAWRSRLQAEVAREENAERMANGGANRNRLFVRFGPTR